MTSICCIPTQGLQNLLNILCLYFYINRLYYWCFKMLSLTQVPDNYVRPKVDAVAFNKQLQRSMNI